MATDNSCRSRRQHARSISPRRGDYYSVLDVPRRPQWQAGQMLTEGSRVIHLDLSWAKLVRTFGADFGEHLPDLVGDRVFGGEGVGAGSDGDLPVAA